MAKKSERELKTQEDFERLAVDSESLAQKAKSLKEYIVLHRIATAARIDSARKKSEKPTRADLLLRKIKTGLGLGLGGVLGGVAGGRLADLHGGRGALPIAGGALAGLALGGLAGGGLGYGLARWDEHDRKQDRLRARALRLLGEGETLDAAYSRFGMKAPDKRDEEWM